MRTVEKIQEVLDSKNIKASKMMKDLGFSSGLFSQWKTGKQQVSLEKIVSIANYFGCSVDYLLGRTDEPNGYNNNSINISGHKQLDEMSEELLKRFNELPFDEKLDVFTYIKNKT